MGSRILHQRLKGPSVAEYYPPRIGTISQLRSLYPQYTLIDEEEEDWLEHLNVAKSRGKGAPKKKRTAAGKWGEETITGRPLTCGRIEEIQQEAIDAHEDTTQNMLKYGNDEATGSAERLCKFYVHGAFDGVIYEWTSWSFARVPEFTQLTKPPLPSKFSIFYSSRLFGPCLSTPYPIHHPRVS